MSVVPTGQSTRLLHATPDAALTMIARSDVVHWPWSRLQSRLRCQMLSSKAPSYALAIATGRMTVATIRQKSRLWKAQEQRQGIVPHPLLPGQTGEALAGRLLQESSQPEEAGPTKRGQRTPQCDWQLLSQQWWPQSNGVGQYGGCQQPCLNHRSPSNYNNNAFMTFEAPPPPVHKKVAEKVERNNKLAKNKRRRPLTSLTTVARTWCMTSLLRPWPKASTSPWLFLWKAIDGTLQWTILSH